ncbi:twin transmembrane helix small protein [Alkalilimnicola sp. S0819]|uniref:twin transmembrane helix small protein n=1 Tax=Alkalilimnicola sp. S0819 TaxID=2613922 RepID=UPI0012628979|nr:twin transmembrane helix small protein [Alkalilimnicola sp. S0819]KAB7624437.1 twin transmembrane helix small protein [Alkalilimnicola sp. S0819]MPQ16270.1 twin transmembrane helix small protein [Alkalilimnicola sp. S0819]
MDLLLKGLIVLALIAILISLGSGMVFMFRDRSTSRRTVRALTVRIALSVALVLLVLLGLVTGVISPNESPLLTS